jgi:nucleoside-diphosphate-sugar epimerase
MAEALIGCTGFVGGNLLRQAAFDDLYHSRNIADIRGRRYERLVCAGARAEKWKANQDPEGDRRGLRVLTDALEHVEARQVILISTVDVYPEPVGVDEDTPIDAARATAYGRHRFELEQFCTARFDTLVVRLPGLFGPGLRKNVIYDLLNNNQVHKINAANAYQYYNLDRLWADVQTALRLGLRTVNFATEPVATAEVAARCFGRALPAPAVLQAGVQYDFRSRHASRFGGSGGYLYHRDQVLAELQRFVAAEQGRRAA